MALAQLRSLSRVEGSLFLRHPPGLSVPVTALNTSIFHIVSLELSLLIMKPIKIRSSLYQDEYLAPIGHVIMR